MVGAPARRPDRLAHQAPSTRAAGARRAPSEPLLRGGLFGWVHAPTRGSAHAPTTKNIMDVATAARAAWNYTAVRRRRRANFQPSTASRRVAPSAGRRSAISAPPTAQIAARKLPSGSINGVATA